MIRAEFTIYPFLEGNSLPAHVQAAVDAIRSSGLDIEVGPLSNTVTGSPDDVLTALHAAVSAAVSEGATRVVVNIETVR